ncbi:MAG: RNA polymerase sigma-I factor [Thermoanaerobacteraceae bacterium]|nr:RNA polymerase sigma-I factor [Thermoanaerobacteraceae bacterium]
MEKYQSLNERVISIKQNAEEINRLIEEYKSFIASTVEKHLGRYVEYGIDDELSIALIAFHEAIQKYDIKKGNFLTFAKITIRNRLIDYYRKEQKAQGPIVYVEPDKQQDDEESANLYVDESMKEYTEAEKSELRRLELEEIKKELSLWGISFADVARSSPKQEGTRRTYLAAIDFIMNNPDIADIIKNKKYLPVEKITAALKIPRKRIERGRNYIIAAVLILSGDYQFINEYIKWR